MTLTDELAALLPQDERLVANGRIPYQLPA
jgi:hypothetical protein